MQPVEMTAVLSFIVRQAGEGRSSPSATMLKNITNLLADKLTNTEIMLTFAKTFRTAVQLYKLCKIKMKKIYKANFLANNGTRFEKPVEDSNLERIIKSIRQTAEGERFDRNTCSWSVWVDDDSTSEGYRMVAAGGMGVNGARYRIKGNDLKCL